jgi:hypothetical protein
VLGLALAIAAWNFRVALLQYRGGEPLGLPGMERVSLPPATVLSLRTLCENVRAYAGTLFSMRGVYSFNLWTDRPTPTLMNTTMWFAILKPESQREIIDALERDRRAVLISTVGETEYGELYQYLRREFTPAFTIDYHIFSVHKDRRIAPLSTARLFARSGGLLTLEATLARRSEPITRIEVRRLGPPSRQLFVLSPATASLRSVGLKQDGSELEATREVMWPAVLDQPITRLHLEFAGNMPSEADLAVYFFSGRRRVAMAPIAH